MNRTPEQVVRDFAKIVDSCDIDAIVNACTEDVVYANVPVPPMVGREAMRKFFSKNMTRCDRFEMQIRALAVSADGRQVLTERIDKMVFGGKEVAAPLMGIFELRDGKISAWRDYFDVSTFARDMRTAGVEAGSGIAEKYA
jgi:limonene-1,2-epoxide hydrolase